MSVGDKLDTKHYTKWKDLPEAEDWCNSNGLKTIEKTPTKIIAGVYKCPDRKIRLLLMYETSLTPKGRLRVYLTELCWEKDTSNIRKLNKIRT
jgi:hypothetical protein